MDKVNPLTKAIYVCIFILLGNIENVQKISPITILKVLSLETRF